MEKHKQSGLASCITIGVEYQEIHSNPLASLVAVRESMDINEPPTAPCRKSS